MNMKKLTSLFTAGAIALSLAACNDKETKTAETKAPENDTVYLYTWTEYVQMVC